MRNDGVASTDRCLEAKRLADVDATRTRQLGADNGGDEARRKHTVGDTTFEHRHRCEFVVKVNRVGVAGNASKCHDVGFGNSFSENIVHTDFEVFKIISMKFIHGIGQLVHPAYPCSGSRAHSQPQQMRAVQYKGCKLIQQESVWWLVQSKIRHGFRSMISQLRSYNPANHTNTALWAFFCAALILTAPSFSKADSIVLELPIDCQVGSTCWLVNLVDSNPGPSHQDYKCGPISYNTHRGTDIAIANKQVMAAGVSVLASAPGTVIGTRDGMPETTPAELKSRTNIRGRECGNGVTIRHSGKWTTQYCHMKAGSVRVKRGDKVETGDRLGDVGLSGLTQFPHVHVAVREGDTVIDPFTGGAQSSLCDPTSNMQGLWSASARKALEYPGPQPFHLGFDIGKPDIGKIRAGLVNGHIFESNAPALVFWAEAYTLQKGDIMSLTLIGPDGMTINESRTELDRPQARRYGFVGKKRPPGGWPVGTYTGRIEIMRGTIPAVREVTATVE